MAFHNLSQAEKDSKKKSVGSLIKSYPDFPKKGVIFRYCSTLGISDCLLKGQIILYYILYKIVNYLPGFWSLNFIKPSVILQGYFSNFERSKSI